MTRRWRTSTVAAAACLCYYFLSNAMLVQATPLHQAAAAAAVPQQPSLRRSRPKPRYSRRPVRVFILAGDDACEGHASIEQLRHLAANTTGYKHLIDYHANDDNQEETQWTVRNDVYVTYDRHRSEALIHGPLSADGPFASSSSTFGPELEMGNVLGDSFEEPVIIVKAAWAGRSLAKDFRSPSAGGTTGFQYSRMMASLRRTLANLPSILGGDALEAFQSAGYTLEGMVWWHGYSDLLSGNSTARSTMTAEYGANLKSFIRDVRKEMQIMGSLRSTNKKKNKKFPIVIGELGGQGTGRNVSSDELHFRATQASVTHDGASHRQWTRYVPTSVHLEEDKDQGDISENHNGQKYYRGQASAMIRIGRAYASELLEMISHQSADSGNDDNDFCSARERYTQLLLLTAIAFTSAAFVAVGSTKHLPGNGQSSALLPVTRERQEQEQDNETSSCVPSIASTIDGGDGDDSSVGSSIHSEEDGEEDGHCFCCFVDGSDVNDKKVIYGCSDPKQGWDDEYSIDDLEAQL